MSGQYLTTGALSLLSRGRENKLSREYTYTVTFSGSVTITVDADSEEEARDLIENAGPTMYCGNGSTFGLLGFDVYGGVDFHDAYIDDMYLDE